MQHRATLDTLSKYRQLYTIEKQISDAYRQADLTSQEQFATADKAYRNQVSITATLLDQRNAALDRAEIAEKRLKEVAGRQPKTAVGRAIRKAGRAVGTTLKIIGGLAVASLPLRLL